MTNLDLAALSEAATQGEWRIVGSKGLTIRCGDSLIGKFNWNTGTENAALIVGLVNEYRAGRLVHIDEGMQERVWHDYRFQAACHRYAHNGGSSEAIAAAAIAAMMGGAK